MGMRDESWCNSCGCSQPYSEDEVTCGACVSEETTQSNVKLIEYMKLHLISLEQDVEKLSDYMEGIDMDSKYYEELDFEYNNLSGQTIATAHLLSVANDILLKTKGN